MLSTLLMLQTAGANMSSRNGTHSESSRSYSHRSSSSSSSGSRSTYRLCLKLVKAVGSCQKQRTWVPGSTLSSNAAAAAAASLALAAAAVLRVAVAVAKLVSSSMLPAALRIPGLAAASYLMLWQQLWSRVKAQQ
jgi:hypothetical protein